MSRILRCKECGFDYEASKHDVDEKITIQKEKHKEKTGHKMKEVEN